MGLNGKSLEWRGWGWDWRRGVVEEWGDALLADPTPSLLQAVFPLVPLIGLKGKPLVWREYGWDRWGGVVGVLSPPIPPHPFCTSGFLFNPITCPVVRVSVFCFCFSGQWHQASRGWRQNLSFLPPSTRCCCCSMPASAPPPHRMPLATAGSGGSGGALAATA